MHKALHGRLMFVGGFVAEPVRFYKKQDTQRGQVVEVEMASVTIEPRGEKKVEASCRRFAKDGSVNPIVKQLEELVADEEVVLICEQRAGMSNATASKPSKPYEMFEPIGVMDSFEAEQLLGGFLGFVSSTAGAPPAGAAAAGESATGSGSEPSKGRRPGLQSAG